jgi:hypothetical protein
MPGECRRELTIQFAPLLGCPDLSGQPNIKGFWISHEPLSFYLFIFRVNSRDGLKAGKPQIQKGLGLFAI